MNKKTKLKLETISKKIDELVCNSEDIGFDLRVILEDARNDIWESLREAK